MNLHAGFLFKRNWNPGPRQSARVVVEDDSETEFVDDG